MEEQVFLPANILLPVSDMKKWSVVACDQYTSDMDYWDEVEAFVGDNPSTLRITLPEIYLDEPDINKRIEKINRNMVEYIDKNLFKTIENSYIYIERTLSSGKVRKGLIGVLDLEKYDFSEDSGSLIRATEGTILSRIPPRVNIRRNALLELPHIMVLIDDRDKTVIEPLCEAKGEILYDFELMQNSGHIKGYKVNDTDNINKALQKLKNQDFFNKKYNVSDKPVLLFAVGDGNHSLATAKTCYEEIKNKYQKEALNHPSRYALVELVNLHDTSLEFEAIHRVLFNCDINKLFLALKHFYPSVSFCEEEELSGHCFKIITKSKTYTASIKAPALNLTVGTLQAFLDDYLKENSGRLDYIHGEEEVYKNVRENLNCVGFLLPQTNKNDLFKTVILDGSLPRKTFSMGNAQDKRFYLEAREIKGDSLK